MFEDILEELYENLNKENIKSIDDFICPNCKSINLEHYIGYFASSKEYIAFYKCNNCNKKWKVSIGENVEIKNIKEI